MTAQIVGVGTDSCHWPLEKAVNPISLLYTDADSTAKIRGPRHGVGIEDNYRGPQGEPTVAHRDYWGDGELWTRLAERNEKEGK